MARRAWLALWVTGLAWLAVPAVPATAGGGCHRGPTEGTGDTVEMVDACFTPTLLRVEPGDPVAFVNKDAFVHNVAGNGWGHFDDLYEADVFTATFDAPGVYPFACSYHPGMVGAILVGDGTGAGDGETVSVASFERPQPEVEVRTVTEPTSSTPVVVGWTLGGAIGLALGLGIATGARALGRGGP